jgi:hypothetical protein
MQKFVLFLALVLSCLTASAQQNLVKNPASEQISFTNYSAGKGWWISDATGSLNVEPDTIVAFRGKPSVRFHADADCKSVLVSPLFAVAPGDNLHFQVRVRAENLPPNRLGTHAGVAFRDNDGKVIRRAYFESAALSTNWSLVSGDVTAPAGVKCAEVHLGYTNAPGTVWFDDVSAVITNLLSLSLAEPAKPWAGPQEISVRVANRQTNEFRGSISRVVAKGTRTPLPIVLEPNSSRDVKLPICLAVGTHNYKISLLDASGQSLRALEGKIHIEKPLLVFPADPCYQIVGEGHGRTRIDASLNMNPAQFAGMRLSVTVSNTAGEQIDQATAEFSPEGRGGVDLHLPMYAPGVFNVTVRLLDQTGHEITSADTDVHVIRPGESRVTMRPDGFLDVAGKPSFPIGMYSCGRYEEMGKAGFTATHEYGTSTGEADDSINSTDPHLKELLDRSWANGMRMMVELPRKAIEQAKWQQVRRRIETFRHHPGLLCWGSEERVARGLAPLANTIALYKLVHELDPDHPLVLGDTRDVIQKFQVDRRDFFPDAAMDVGIWWWYPIPLKTGEANALEGSDKSAGLMEPPSWLTTTHSQKPLWIAIQSYQKPSKVARFPTPAEYRCQAYLSIINGVKGLFFYTGSGQRDYLGKPAGLLNKPKDGHWDYVKQLVGELREFTPVIMAPKSSAKTAMSPETAPVEFTQRQCDGKLYLIAANKSDRPQKIQFTSTAISGHKARVLYENHHVEIQSDSLTDDFPPFAVHIYRFEN